MVYPHTVLLAHKTKAMKAIPYHVENQTHQPGEELRRSVEIIPEIEYSFQKRFV